MNKPENEDFTTSMLDVDVLGGHVITLEEIDCNDCTSYAITMTRLDETDPTEYHEYYEYELDLFDAIEHFKKVVTYVGSKTRS